jgi:predicted Zn-dependent protease
VRSRRLLIALVIVGIGAATYWFNTQENPVTGEKQRVGGITPEQEVALGLQSAPQMAAEFGGLHPDREVQAYVERVGQDVVARSGAQASPYQFAFHALADPQTVNAFALPGGQVFITAALLGRLEDEGQLAGVLGHEIGHVVGRHSAEHLAKGQFLQVLVGATGVAAGSDQGDGRQAAAIAAMVAQMIQLRYGREDELESDRLGVRFLSESGRDPRALIDVMRILAEASGGGDRRPDFMSTHPDPGRRTETIEAEIRKLHPGGVPPGLAAGDRGAFARIKQRL